MRGGCLRSRIWLALFVLALAPLAPPAPAALADERIGVVLLHGEQGAPGRVIAGLGGALVKAGFPVGRPDMCWSARRGYEATFPACLAAIDTAAVKLRNLGAGSIVVAGFSLGGTAAIGWCADHPDCRGVIAIAPGHDAHALAARPEIAESIARARDMQAKGHGDDTATFADLCVGPSGPYATEIATTPAIYLSFFGDASRAGIADGITRLAAPLLWVGAADDAASARAGQALFARAPMNERSRYLAVAGPPLAAPDAAAQPVVAWLRALGPAP